MDQQYPDFHARVWVLLLLRATSQAGLSPIGNELFHRLVYFSNCLSAVYGENPPAAMVMKMRRGPFYPKAQWDLDCLAVQGLATVSDVDYVRVGQLQIYRAHYDISRAGIVLSKQFVEELTWCQHIFEFFGDLLAAFADLRDENFDAAALHDLTYNQPGRPDRSVISFIDEETNLSALGTQSLVDTVPDIVRPNRQHRLLLYMKYLERLAA
jgi:hypothetical protein